MILVLPRGDQLDALAILLDEDQYVQGQARELPDPVLLGRRMAALYRCWSGREGVDLVDLTEGFLGRLGAIGEPIGRTCLEAAAEVARWGGHPYHSARHHAEVATNAMMIAELAGRIGQPMSSRYRGLLLASSLAHDIYFQPLQQPRTRFAAETVSARALDGIAARCGLDSDDRRALWCLILATEPSFRSVLAKLLAGHAASKGLPRRLGLLTRQPALAGIAAALSDADLLSSSGLTERWHDVQITRLESESGNRIGPDDDKRFFALVVGDDFLSTAGRHFSSNLARIRRCVADHAAH